MLHASQCDPSSMYAIWLQSKQNAQSEVAVRPCARTSWKVVEDVAAIALSPLVPRNSAMSARQLWGTGGRLGGQRVGSADLWRVGGCVVPGPGWLASPMRVPRVGSWCRVCVGSRVQFGSCGLVCVVSGVGCWNGLWSPTRLVNVVGVRGCD